MTDSLQYININVNKKICLVSDINPDGIGDLMLQIRAFHILNKQYPGMIECITFAIEKNIQNYRAIAKDHNFKTIFYDLVSSRSWTNTLLSEHEFQLIIQISYVLDHQPILNNNIRHYMLSEIKYHDPLYMRDKMGFLGFMPEAEGLFRESVIPDKDPSNILMSLPGSLKNLLNLPANFTVVDEANSWYRATWIAQSCYYELNHFMVSLVAQLYYISESCPDISNVIIKYHGKNRDGKHWNIVDTLQHPLYKSVLNACNIKSILINDISILVNATHGITLRLCNEYLMHNEYKIYMQLLNGCYLPSGDNTYCEAWSNIRTRIPPFPELRDYKQSSLNPIFSAIDHLDLDENSKIFLHDHVVACLYMHTHVKNNTEEAILIYISRRISNVWSKTQCPQAAWRSLSQYISKQNLNERLISIVKEQLLFAQYPELVDVKYQLIFSQSSDAVERYQATIKSKICSQTPGDGASSSKLTFFA